MVVEQSSVKNDIRKQDKKLSDCHLRGPRLTKTHPWAASFFSCSLLSSNLSERTITAVFAYQLLISRQLMLLNEQPFCQLHTQLLSIVCGARAERCVLSISKHYLIGVLFCWDTWCWWCLLKHHKSVFVLFSCMKETVTQHTHDSNSSAEQSINRACHYQHQLQAECTMRTLGAHCRRIYFFFMLFYCERPKCATLECFHSSTEQKWKKI